VDLTAVSTVFNVIKADILSALLIVVPVALGILGMFLVWKLGIKWFKNFTDGDDKANRQWYRDHSDPADYDDHWPYHRKNDF